MQGAVGLHHFTQRAVDPEPHAAVALVRFDMDVAGTVTCGLRQQRIQQPDNRRVVCGL